MSYSGCRGGSPRPWFIPRRGAPALRLASLLAIVLWLTVVPTAGAQQSSAGSPRRHRGIQVIPLRDLRFGNVIPGVVTRVDPDRQRQSGLFAITGQRNMSVRIDLHLPSLMEMPTGEEFRILFSREDGTVSANRGRGENRPFNPHEPLIVTLGRNGRLYVRLGGSVAPHRLQARGLYTATITLTVANLGS